MPDFSRKSSLNPRAQGVSKAFAGKQRSSQSKNFMAMSDNMESMEDFAIPSNGQKHSMLGNLPSNNRNSSSLSLTNSG